MTLLLPTFVLGLIAAIITELLKLFPQLSISDERKRIVAFAVCLVISFIYVFAFTTGDGLLIIITGSLAATFISYKTVVQPVEAIVKGVKDLVVSSEE